MRKVFIAAAAILLSAVLFTTCTYRANDPSVCFSENVLPIFVSNCGGCHGNYTTYQGLVKDIVKYHPLRSKIYKQIHGANPKMPPESHTKLTEQQLYTIKVWISSGAPNSSNCSGCDTSKYKFTADIVPIMSNWCTTCHNAGNAGGGFDLSNYSGVNACVNSGKFMPSIKHTGPFPMPQGGAKLSDCDITKLQNWVNAGHLNN